MPFQRSEQEIAGPHGDYHAAKIYGLQKRYFIGAIRIQQNLAQCQESRITGAGCQIDEVLPIAISQGLAHFYVVDRVTVDEVARGIGEYPSCEYPHSVEKYACSSFPFV
jgi:hypothetical protein